MSRVDDSAKNSLKRPLEEFMSDLNEDRKIAKNEENVSNGHSHYHDQLSKKFPANLESIFSYTKSLSPQAAPIPIFTVFSPNAQVRNYHEISKLIFSVFVSSILHPRSIFSISTIPLPI